jgi:hypothetical protein
VAKPVEMTADVRQTTNPAPMSDETVRVNALNAALNITGRTNAPTTADELLKIADQIAEWIRHGSMGD